ncbi:MAG: DUF3368 domain-containing protein [Cyanobacteria bacterium P01_F01_bin.3]
MTRPIADSCVVSDSTCLIGLERIKRLDILPKLYSRFYIPLAVKAEIGFSEPWMTVCEVKNTALVSSLRTQLDWGESEAIALALDLKAAVLLVDGKKARKVAAQFDIVLTGTAGMLLKAKRQGVISSVAPILSALEAVDFRLSYSLRHRTLELADEL